jgi:hypothetical protein
MSEQAPVTFTFTFPLDIERLIFEEAASDDTPIAFRLALVSRQAQSWSVDVGRWCTETSEKYSLPRVEPIMYRIVTLKTQWIKDTFMRSLNITTKPLSFYTECIKALYLPFDFTRVPSTHVKLLSLCKEVECLVCWIYPKSVDTQLGNVITAMRPRRLVAQLTNLLGTSHPNFSLPFFDNLTHLEISDFDEWSTWSGIHRLPCLSHILLPVSNYARMKAVPSDAEQMVNDLLSHCGTLQVCVIRYERSDYPDHELWYPTLAAVELIEDVRLVFVLDQQNPNLDWHAFVKGKTDTWIYAEAVVARQREVGRIVACQVPEEVFDD